MKPQCIHRARHITSATPPAYLRGKNLACGTPGPPRAHTCAVLVPIRSSCIICDTPSKKSEVDIVAGHGAPYIQIFCLFSGVRGGRKFVPDVCSCHSWPRVDTFMGPEPLDSPQSRDKPSVLVRRHHGIRDAAIFDLPSGT